ncbi:metal ABC transporter solute-binding protein, Zn/Mn family [Abyssicoccus albus]|uniref:Manganese/zinc/iron transport system substrate-binding protein n=1 Tax=Abyssicoccus albus TaxID=1817405 RepID=A0A3N5BCX7_9BACL|nr:zinc ABC transporter substrate-binding protein [Abyssicoccus albus]RPF54799.1 manganese/zinc/iron transport system substrate-binding protein [Abyssicoccus albus]
MKKKIYLSIGVALMALIFAACSSNTEAGKDKNKPELVVTTTFLNDMVAVLEEGVEAFNTELIIPAGEDPHVYEPKASDLRALNEADVILYHGLNFEGRMTDVLNEGVSVTENFDTGTLEEMGYEEEIVVDPHFWFNLDLYKQAFERVKDTLIENNPEGEEQYEKNYEAYIAELNELDQYIENRIQEIPAESRILVTPHDAFGYLSTAYDMEVHAPQGISTDSEVSNNQIQKTADIIVDNNVKAIFVETTTNPDRMRRIQEVVASQGGEVELVGEGNELLSDSLAKEGENGDTFLSMYRHNIDIIVEHLK